MATPEWDADRPEGFFAKVGWGLRTSAKAVGGAFSAGASAVKESATDIVTGKDKAQRDEIARREEEARLAARAASAAKTRKTLLVLGVLAVGAFFYFKRKKG